MDIGVFGGTFDPIHNGHLVIAQEVYSSLHLSTVLFIPAGKPWLKVRAPLAAVEDRVQMLRLALAGWPYFQLSLVEVERPGISYTVDTLLELKNKYKNDELFFILGWDSLATLSQWKDTSRLITLCRLVAVPRPGCVAPDLQSLEQSMPGISERVILMDHPLVDISATHIRRRAEKGKALEGLVSPPIARYIKEHKLYVKFD